MLVNAALVIVIALLAAMAFERVNLPGLLGMVLTGILLGPHALALLQGVVTLPAGVESTLFLSDELLHISPDLRQAALFVILIRAGLGISKATLNRVGGAALRMGSIPCLLEGATVAVTARLILQWSWVEAGLLGFVLAAVSPAVVVPQMLGLKESGHGEEKEVPTLILAGSSLDDVFAITLFGALLNMTRIGREQVSLARELLHIPVSIAVGIAAGLLIGWLLVRYFRLHPMRHTRKAVIIMVAAILLFHVGELDLIPMAGLLGIMAIGFMILECDTALAKAMAAKFNTVWVIAEIVLFVLIGAEVRIDLLFRSGLIGLAIVAVGLAGRSLGVWFALLKSHLNTREKTFCMVANLPKATVQAAIGGIVLSEWQAGTIALAHGQATGDTILAMAVLAIVVTAPLGVIGINLTASRCLTVPTRPTD